MYSENLIQPQNFEEGRTAKIDCRFSWSQSRTMNLFFARHAFHPFIPLGSEDEVAESLIDQVTFSQGGRLSVTF